VITAPAGIPAITNDLLIVPKAAMLAGIVILPELIVVGPAVPPVAVTNIGEPPKQADTGEGAMVIADGTRL
jgi:hypothetical protein